MGINPDESTEDRIEKLSKKPPEAQLNPDDKPLEATTPTPPEGEKKETPPT
jgi:hypothetical protein